MGAAGRAYDRAVAAHGNPLEPRVAIGQHRAGEAFQEFDGAIAMPADREVEHVQRHGQATLSPHVAGYARFLLLHRLLKDFVDAL